MMVADRQARQAAERVLVSQPRIWVGGACGWGGMLTPSHPQSGWGVPWHLPPPSPFLFGRFLVVFLEPHISRSMGSDSE